MAQKKHFVYRDSRTGRFAKKATWARSRSHGGRRYQKIKVAAVVQKRRAGVAPAPIPSAPGGGGGGSAPRSSNVIGSLADYFDYYDYDFDVDEYEVGVDY